MLSNCAFDFESVKIKELKNQKNYNKKNLKKTKKKVIIKQKLKQKEKNKKKTEKPQKIMEWIDFIERSALNNKYSNMCHILFYIIRF